MLGRKKYLISGLVVTLAFGYLGYTGFQGTTTYYYTVAELLDQGSAIHGENVRVGGELDPESVEQESAGFILKFTIIEGSRSLPVFYQGGMPDTFNAASEVVVEGYLDANGVFQAHTILTKCPSKYVPES